MEWWKVWHCNVGNYARNGQRNRRYQNYHGKPIAGAITRRKISRSIQLMRIKLGSILISRVGSLWDNEFSQQKQDCIWVQLLLKFIEISSNYGSVRKPFYAFLIFSKEMPF